MRKPLLTLFALLALSLTAHADLYPGSYSVQVQGALGGTSPSPYTMNAFANVPGYGIVPFNASLAPTSASFSFSTQKFDIDKPQFDLTGVLFIGNRVADKIVGFYLEPSSTISGIVATTSISSYIPGVTYPYTYIDFDFSNVNYTAGSHATIDFIFASTQTPEPASLLLLLTGVGTIGGAIRRRLQS